MSLSGMELAGRHGASVLSIADPTVTKHDTRSLKGFWAIGEETAERHGKTMNRSEWRLVVHAYIAETRKEAIEQARVGASKVPARLLRELDGPRGDLRRPCR